MFVHLHPRSALVGLAASLCLAGCQVDVPVLLSGKAVAYAQGKPGKEWTLSAGQLADAQRWLAQRPSGWTLSYTTYAPGLYATLETAGGKPATVNVLGSSVILNRTRQYVQEFPEADLALLRSALGAM